MLYLTPNPPPQAGTTLYRSRWNKARSVGEVAAQYVKRGMTPDPAAIEQGMYKGKLLDPTAWEPIDVLGNMYNRLVVWDAKLVHAASCYFGNDINDGRLFQMFFFDTEKNDRETNQVYAASQPRSV